MKKVFFIFTIYSFLFVQIASANEGFLDVSIAHPNYKAITFLKNQEIVGGYEDNTFKPERTVSRAELVKITLNAVDIDVDEEFEIDFKDVPNDAWYAPYIAKAKDLEIIGGYDDNSFRPDNTVTRTEGIKIILNAYKVQLPEVMGKIYEDVTKDDLFAPYVLYVKNNNLLDIDGDYFDVNAGFKRKDIAQILYRIMLNEKLESIPKIPYFLLLLALACWIIPGFICIKNTCFFNKISKYHYLLIFMGLIYCLFEIICSFSKVEISKDEVFDPNVDRNAMRRHTYFKRPRKLGSEFCSWLIVNAKSLLMLLGIIILFKFEFFFIETMINNYDISLFEIELTNLI